MARGINKVILIGNLGADPEVRYTYNSDNQVHQVVFFGRLAEIVKEYLRKGSQIYIEGRLQTRKWQGQDGQDRYTTEIVANDMQMLGSRGGGSGGYERDSSAPPSGSRSSAPSGDRPPAFDNAPPDFDDDIPF